MRNKKCPHCKIIKPVNEFYKNGSSRDNLSRWCKFCTKEYNYIHKEKNAIYQKEGTVRSWHHTARIRMAL